MCAREEAARLDLAGWVRNLLNGAVEVVAEGDRDNVDKFLAWCRRGPSYARVMSVKEEYSDATGEFDSFEIVH